ncbi:hypothetical protein [Marine gokushovirus]|nr:hypothetical protein [Marine gokushovirus]
MVRLWFPRNKLLIWKNRCYLLNECLVIYSQRSLVGWIRLLRKGSRPSLMLKSCYRRLSDVAYTL